MAPGGPYRARGQIGHAGLLAGGGGSGTAGSGDFADQIETPTANGTAASVGIELEIDGVVVRVGSGTNAKTIAAVIQALKGGL